MTGSQDSWADEQHVVLPRKNLEEEAINDDHSTFIPEIEINELLALDLNDLVVGGAQHIGKPANGTQGL